MALPEIYTNFTEIVVSKLEGRHLYNELSRKRTRKLLDEALRTKSCSKNVGVCWILTNPWLLTKIVGDPIDDFMLLHICNDNLRRLVTSLEILNLISPLNRLLVFSAFYMRRGQKSPGWTDTALKAQITPEQIAKLIYDRLRLIKDRDDSMNEFRHFMDKNGSGTAFLLDNKILLPQNTPWGVMNDQQFFMTLEVVLGKAPKLIETNWQYIVFKLQNNPKLLTDLEHLMKNSR